MLENRIETSLSEAWLSLLRLYTDATQRAPWQLTFRNARLVSYCLTTLYTHATVHFLSAKKMPVKQLLDLVPSTRQSSVRRWVIAVKAVLRNELKQKAMNGLIIHYPVNILNASGTERTKNRQARITVWQVNTSLSISSRSCNSTELTAIW